jgi:hypothetical protein
MGAAAVLRKIMAVARPEALLSRAEVLTRYRHLREISKRHHSACWISWPRMRSYPRLGA